MGATEATAALTLKDKNGNEIEKQLPGGKKKVKTKPQARASPDAPLRPARTVISLVQVGPAGNTWRIQRRRMYISYVARPVCTSSL